MAFDNCMIQKRLETRNANKPLKINDFHNRNALAPPSSSFLTKIRSRKSVIMQRRTLYTQMGLFLEEVIFGNNLERAFVTLAHCSTGFDEPRDPPHEILSPSFQFVIFYLCTNPRRGLATCAPRSYPRLSGFVNLNP